MVRMISSTLSAYRSALSDPDFPRAKTLGFTLSVAALTLIEPRSLSPRSLTVYRAAVSTCAGLAVADSVRTVPLPIGHGTLGAVATGATAALMPLSEKSDAIIVDGAKRVFGRTTRPLLAGVTAAAMFDAMVRQHRDEQQGETFPEFDEPSDAEERDLTPKERAVLEVLASKDFPGAEAIRSQLSSVRALDWGEPMTGQSVLDLQVSDPQQLIVPHFQTWPVAGVFEAEGRRFSAELGIMDGVISTLYLSPVGETEDELMEGAELLDARSFEDALPDASAVKPTLESALPTR